MLFLEDLVKAYPVGSGKVDALRGVSLRFRKSEFVSILGPSGCGKTTLLNLIGALDTPTSGRIMWNEKLLSELSDRKKDAYRNHAVGFVFQAYNLIAHQSILANVELSLTLAGIGLRERRRKALEALEKVGLAAEAGKRPSQLSGGQMQRVAIARALVNDPEILLADEPTGALDSETGIQVMELLAEIAKTRLVIMVTHNPELAQTYSTRLIRMKDGRVISDSNPPQEDAQPEETAGMKRTSMGFVTALRLSMSNLLTKKTRSLLVAFAGSIGIIGIALILALSTGARKYIDRVEKEALTSYPLTLEKQSMDINGILASFTGGGEIPENEPETARSSAVLEGLLKTLFTGAHENDLTAFKAYIENDPAFEALGVSVQYSYPITLNIWRRDGETPLQVNPSTTLADLNAAAAEDERTRVIASMGLLSGDLPLAGNVFTELPGDEAALPEKYTPVYGRLPKEKNELVLILDSNGNLSDYALYTLGIRDRSELMDVLLSVMTGTDAPHADSVFSYDTLMALDLRLVLPTDLYRDTGSKWSKAARGTEAFDEVLGASLELRIVGIVKPASADLGSGTAAVGYLPELTRYAMDRIVESDVVRAQKENPDYDILSGMPFGEQDFSLDLVDMGEYEAFVKTVQLMVGAERMDEIIRSVVPTYGSKSSYEGNMAKFSLCDENDPSSIRIYAPSFEAKQALTDYIDRYNAASGKSIQYTDYIGLLLGSVTDIVDSITYVLIAFVAVSLIVSSLMIGIITYISVMERTKEIGILRALGASRRDVSRVFRAETLVIGFAAGVLGIGVSLAALIPINRVIASLSGVEGLAVLPVGSAVCLIAISMLLTLIAGLIPAKIAAGRDPVVALRSE